MEFAEDFRLLKDIGWGEDEDRETFDLTMPPHDLMEVLGRLQGDAERLFIESPSERRATEEDEEVSARFQRGLDACEELLADLHGELRSVGVGGSIGGFRLFESTPPEINHIVLTGLLSVDPRPGRSPGGDPVTLLWIEFPVADPNRSETLWAWASCLVEVPGGRMPPEDEDLRGGAAVIVSGQLSDRWVIENGHTSRRGVIVAHLIKAGLSPAQLEL